MSLGYSLGPMWLRAPQERQGMLLIGGIFCVAAFVILRSVDPAVGAGLDFPLPLASLHVMR